MHRSHRILVVVDDIARDVQKVNDVLDMENMPPASPSAVHDGHLTLAFETQADADKLFGILTKDHHMRCKHPHHPTL